MGRIPIPSGDISSLDTVGFGIPILNLNGRVNFFTIRRRVVTAFPCVPNGYVAVVMRRRAQLGIRTFSTVRAAFIIYFDV